MKTFVVEIHAIVESEDDAVSVQKYVEWKMSQTKMGFVIISTKILKANGKKVKPKERD